MGWFGRDEPPERRNRPSPTPSGGKIDSVFTGPDGSAKVVLSWARPWEEGGKRLDQLQDKLNLYADFIMSGELVRRFPAFKGKPASIEVMFTTVEPHPQILDLTKRAAEVLASHGVTLNWQVVPE